LLISEEVDSRDSSLGDTEMVSSSSYIDEVRFDRPLNKIFFLFNSAWDSRSNLDSSSGLQATKGLSTA
jgi:hypothetical protein